MSDELNTSMVEFEVDNHYDIKELRQQAKSLRNMADRLDDVADNMEKGSNIRANRIFDEEDE